jgi:hypothetical protein
VQPDRTGRRRRAADRDPVVPGAHDASLDAALCELQRVSARLLVTVPTGVGEQLPEQAVLGSRRR